MQLTDHVEVWQISPVLDNPTEGLKSHRRLEKGQKAGVSAG
jgi:hypothetical protein